MLSQLREIVEQVSRVDDLHQALSILVKKTCSAMNTECCTVYLANEEMERLELMATQGLTFKGDSIHIRFSEGLVGRVKRIAEPINVAEASKHPSYKFFPELGEQVYQSFLGTPIIHRKKVLGVLVVQQKSPRLFDESEESFLVTLSAQLAVLIAHGQTLGHWIPNHHSRTLIGVPASTGVAIGRFWLDNTQPNLSEVAPASTVDVDQELERLAMAIEAAQADFRRMRKKLEGELTSDAKGIFDLFAHLLNDPMLKKDLKQQVQQFDRAEWALRQVIESYSSRFAKMSDPYLRERAQDFRELGQRLLFFLHNTEQDLQVIEKPIILVVQELTASILASVPKDKLLAVVAIEGAANSHAAILSRALGIPAIMGLECDITLLSGLAGIVDGYSGKLFVSPSRQLLQEYRGLRHEEKELTRMVSRHSDKPAVTIDGLGVDIMLNSGLSADSSIAINQGVDGVGLYRTEISFLLQHRFPSEEEQIGQYKSVLASYPKKNVVMRTLDIGGDKALPYFPIEEENPFLGWRGIRFTLDHPDIFLIQLRAMLRASQGNDNLSILLPMVSNVQEIDDALQLFEQAYQEVSELCELNRPTIGVMIEVPSMLYLLPHIAPKIDFVSVGTNDLTQYLLAVDRNNSRVSTLYETMHPAVLSALKHIKEMSESLNLPVCVCGELAGDPMGALLLVGMGYRSLSMNTSNVAKVKYLLCHSQQAELEALAATALQQPYAQSIYDMMLTHFENKEFAGFIRAGKH
ncbi:phosphoenolpyruvate--protein phosphotransferase [Vibrio sp. FNV 38]|nr:phosphoenolpyruvate--protein phosphotransferase [Vibrio sp. FNV 38]